MLTDRRRFRAGLTVGALLLLALALWAKEGQPQPGVFSPHRADQLLPGELIVRFRPQTSREQRRAVLASYGATVKREMLLDGYVAVSVPPGQEEPVGRALAANWAVRSAEESPLRIPYTHNDPAVPDDQYFDQQWNMRLIQLEQAWDVANDGAGVVVAVVDTGVAFEDYHDPNTGTDFALAPDFAGAVFTDPHDFFDGDDHPNDDLGHGTHVAGTIAQTTNNEIGVAGIAPGATIMPVKVCGYLDPPGVENRRYGCPAAAIADGIVWAVNHGARVINLSLGGPGSTSDAERSAVAYAVQKRVVVVAAAGNGGDDLQGDPQLDFPAALPGVISVGGAGTGGIAASYSNYSPDLDLVAPGGDPKEGADGTYILQNSYGVPCATPPNFTQFWWCLRYGTSMAAAHVSGVAALILSQYPAFKPPRVRLLLTNCAQDVGPQGLDDQNGFGLLQAYNALKDVNPDGRPNGVLDGLEDVDNDDIWDCRDPRVETRVPPPIPTCDAPAPSPLASPGAGAESPAQAANAGPTATETPTGTPTPVATATATPTATATAAASETPAGSPAATASPEPSPTETPTPEPTVAPTDTPAPTLSATPTPTPAPQEYACGDVNCDGSVDARDALLILRWVVHRHSRSALEAQRMDLRCLGNGYVTCGVDVTVADALAILRYRAGLPLNLPAGCFGIG
ncbi:MAG: S8 family serine peptidase [Dehalococcoidia bacterium]|nr:S8 family serine peptidase [Dehalococcoidia bacterium]